jgi:hypothetical protein
VVRRQAGDVPQPEPDPFYVYGRARRLDEWPDQTADGTSVRAGAKAMREYGRLAEFLWRRTPPT